MGTLFIRKTEDHLSNAPEFSQDFPTVNRFRDGRQSEPSNKVYNPHFQFEIVEVTCPPKTGPVLMLELDLE